jgi:hypothetical protein
LTGVANRGVETGTVAVRFALNGIAEELAAGDEGEK